MSSPISSRRPSMVQKLDFNAPVLHAELKVAVKKAAERGLVQSAKWLAEQLTSIATPPTPEIEMGGTPSSSMRDLPLPPADEEDVRLEIAEDDKYLLAKSYFDCHEFDRAARVLEGCRSARSVFLAVYAKFMAGEKRKDEDSEMVLGPLDGGNTPNKELLPLIHMLDKLIVKEGNNDSYLLYLNGVLLWKQKNEKAAKEMLVRAVVEYPYNWAAWEELKSTLADVGDLEQIEPILPDHIMTKFFRLYVLQELYQTSEHVHNRVEELESVFPTSQFLAMQRALLYYHERDFEEAERHFDALLRNDPYRLDGLDHYSNILYVMERRPKLAFIAQVATATDRFRPETCCVVGNYYSLKSEHEKAVMYFRRALNLDKNFLSAWTLMGHEYVEMKNTHAAIEAYRRAVDVNRKDYRAWYGLGQTYEVLEMHYYALFYYQRAAALKPYDAQMWQAMGSCYDRMNRTADSIKAYKRALIGHKQDQISQTAEQKAANAAGFDPNVLHNIAVLYEKLGQKQEARRYMEMCLCEEDETGVTGSTSKARLWIAHYELESGGDYARAQALAKELVEDGVEIEDAKAVIRDARSRQEAQREGEVDEGRRRQLQDL